MTILIIEGCDLAGKTTAIAKIAKHFNSGFTLKNNYKPKEVTPNIILHYWRIMSIIEDYQRIRPDDLIILDRFYPSQAVYSILRGQDEIESDSIKLLDDRCNEKQYLLLYLDTPLEELEKRYYERGDDYIKCDQLKMLKDRYDTFYKNTKLNKIAINTMEDDWLEKIEAFIFNPKRSNNKQKR